jgi:hypothetical protein
VFEEADVGAEFVFLGALAAAVRTMKPPWPFSRSLMTMRFRRWRSSSLLILRDTPVWFTVGM